MKQSELESDIEEALELLRDHKDNPAGPLSPLLNADPQQPPKVISSAAIQRMRKRLSKMVTL